jgi:formate hydrogenlyase transcriptional activator
MILPTTFDSYDNYLYKLALEKLSEGFVLTSDTSEIIYINERACKIYGKVKEEMLGRPMHQFSPRMDANEWSAKWKSILDDVDTRTPIEVIGPGNEIHVVDAVAKRLIFNDRRYIAFHLFPSELKKDPDNMLRMILEGTASVVGKDFFRSLAYHVIAATGMRYAIITECTDVAKTRVRTLVYVERANFLDNFEYQVEGTPCEIIMRGNSYYCTADMDLFFPKEQGIKSYFGVPMFLSNGEVIGHIAIFDTIPYSLTQAHLDILKIFASRAAAEIERKRKDEQIRENMIRYQHLFEDAPIGLCEENYAAMKSLIESLKTKGNVDLGKLFRADGSQLTAVAHKVKRTSLNKAFMELFEVDSINDYTRQATQFFPSEFFYEVLLMIDRGEMQFEKEVKVSTGRGKVKYIKLKLVNIGTSDWTKALLACVDISEQKDAQGKLNNALEEVKALKEKLEAENIYLQEEIKRDHNFDEIVSKSATFNKVLQKVELVSQTDATVLILGESGTGKELIARAIHSISKRSNRPLVKVNCAALPANLIESELFGHEKGAFTGAINQKIGRFELANGGTVFLDEIGEMPLELQAKLLRVLQEGEFERVGSSKTIKVDVRVIAATNRDLQKSVNNQEFRADLYYRLNVFPVLSPPLRERKEDIPVLAKHFCRKYGVKFGKRIDSVSKTVMDSLLYYDWPGNVRELENIIERGLIVTSGAQLEPGEWLPKTQLTSEEDETSGRKTLEELERDYIIEILHATKWKVRGDDGAAKILDLNPTTLEAKMKKLGITRKASDL